MTLTSQSACKPQHERHLMVVDDEENISRSLVRLLKQDQYTIYTANSGKQGLEILAANDIGVIISDQRMPEMSGTEFLSQVSQLYPDTIRIVLSGYTELKTITGAINEGKIYKFLTKPWDDKLLRENIKEAFRQYEMADENRRLTNELSIVNDELSKLNIKLSNSVKTEARSAQINLRSLQVAQEVLQSLPIGIIGIDEDKTIVLANNLAHEIFSSSDTGLIGSNADNILPMSVEEFSADGPGGSRHSFVKDNKHIEVKINLYKHRILNDADATIGVIIPLDGVKYE